MKTQKQYAYVGVERGCYVARSECGGYIDGDQYAVSLIDRLQEAGYLAVLALRLNLLEAA